LPIIVAVGLKEEFMANTFVSPAGTFSFVYPDDWKMVRLEDGTLNLWRKIKKQDSDNILRIRPMISPGVISPQAYAALVSSRKKEFHDVQVIEKSESYIMNFHIIKYRKDSFVNNGLQTVTMVQDCWDLVITNRIFTCTFIAPQEQANSAEVTAEREAAEKVLFSIWLL
jgi:hypothetical protein